MVYSYERYLSSKKTVDDRSLNPRVFERVRNELVMPTGVPLRILEVGAGIGTMVARLIDWGVLGLADYTFLDESADLLAHARIWLSDWATRRGAMVESTSGALRILHRGVDVTIRFEETEIREFLAGDPSAFRADLIIANAFLDLVELPSTLGRLFQFLAPSGLYWLSINYDGESIFLPEHEHDQEFLRVYNLSMDQRKRAGRPAGDSKTGRHLFSHLHSLDATPIAAGASDWVVYARDGSYPADEGYFLHHIVHTVEEELLQHAEIPRAELQEWGRARHAQIDRGELVFVAHQLDFSGRRDPGLALNSDRPSPKGMSL